MATVELKEHVGYKRLQGGKQMPVTFNQDFVILQEITYDANGHEKKERIIAGYCDRVPGASFRPIVNGLPESLMTQIRNALAERDAKWTGKTAEEMFERHVCEPPPAMSDADVAESNPTEEYEDDDDERDDDTE